MFILLIINHFTYVSIFPFLSVFSGDIKNLLEFIVLHFITDKLYYMLRFKDKDYIKCYKMYFSAGFDISVSVTSL